MNYEDLSIMLVPGGDYYDAVLHADSVFQEEFGMDFVYDSSKEKYESLIQYVKKKYPGIPLRLGKILLGGILVGTFAISANLPAFAATVTSRGSAE